MTDAPATCTRPGHGDHPLPCQACRTEREGGDGGAALKLLQQTVAARDARAANAVFVITRDELIDAIARITVRGTRVPGRELPIVSADDMADAVITGFPPSSRLPDDPAEREQLGRLVRDTWVDWAREQPDAKPSWLTGWDELDAGQREVDMRIGQALCNVGRYVRLSERERLHAEGAKKERDRIRELAKTLHAVVLYANVRLSGIDVREFAELIDGQQ